jgi:hypothetical protein
MIWIIVSFLPFWYAQYLDDFFLVGINVGTYLICMHAGEGSRKRKREEVEHVPPPIQEELEHVPPRNQEEEEPVPPPIQEEEEHVPPPNQEEEEPVPPPYQELEESDGSLEVSYIILFSTLPCISFW